MAKKQSSRLFELAKVGAEARLRQLVGEARMLVSSFPHLREAFDCDELPVSLLLAERSGRLKRKSAAGPRRRRLLAEARKRISDAQKKRWAKQRRHQSKSE